MALIVIVCLLRLIASAVGTTFVHPYMVEMYQRSTNVDGSFRPDVRMEDLHVWGFTDDGEVLFVLCRVHISWHVQSQWVRVIHGSVLMYTRAGLMNNTFAAADVGPSAPCEQTMENRISVKTLVEDKTAWNLPLIKAVWRVYVQKGRVRKACSRAEMEVALKVGGSKLGMESRKTIVHRLAISEWVDLDITAALQSIWPLRANWSEIGVLTSVQCRKACTGRRSLPLRLIDLRMVAQNVRESMIDLQPVLALHLRNEASWKSLRESLELDWGRVRTKRSKDVEDLQASHCRKESYNVQFENIPYLRDLVVLPRSYNIGRCVGLCQYDMEHTGRPEHFITNHGLIKTLLLLNPEGWPSSDEPNVTCVPITYKSVQLITRRTSAVESVVYTDFAVSECGCR